MTFAFSKMELEILGKSMKSELTFIDKGLKYSWIKCHLFSNSARYLLGMAFISRDEIHDSLFYLNRLPIL